MFKRQMDYLQNLEDKNKDVQDRIWRKLIGAYEKEEENIRIINSNFESHPSGFSSSSDSEENSIDEDPQNFKNEAQFEIATANLKVVAEEKRNSSASSRMTLSDTSRKKLRKKLAKHLQTGTLDKFEINKGEGDTRENKISKSEKKNSKGKFKPKTKSEEWIEVEKMCEWSDDEIESVILSSSKDNFAIIETHQKKVGFSEVIPEKSKKSIQTIEPKKKKTKSKDNEVKQNKKKCVNNNFGDVMRKIRLSIEKCICALQDIRLILDQGSVPPDGTEDYERRQNRTKEFASRFSRIYMYPLIRLLSEAGSCESKAFCNYQKFSNMFQLVYQGLLTFFNHFPSTVGTTSYHKLKEHLSCTTEICEKYSKLTGMRINSENGDYVTILKSHCEDIMQKLNRFFVSPSMESMMKPMTSRTNIMAASKPSNRNVTAGSATKMNFNKRFSMYNTPLASKRDNSQWRRMVENWQAQKPVVKSRYRTATFKHRPPPDKNTNFSCDKYRLDDKRSLGVLRNTPVTTPLNEDNIKTMIQFDKEQMNDSEEDEHVLEKNYANPSEESVKTEAAKDVDEVRNGNNIQQDDDEDVLTKLLKFGDCDNALNNTILVLQQCLNFKKQNPDLFRKMSEKSIDKKNERFGVKDDVESKKKKKPPIVTVSGTNNAKLICIKDDNSISTCSSEEELMTKRSVVEISDSDVVQKSSSQFACRGKIENKSSVGNISKICRVKRPRKMLQQLPNEYSVNVIRYKLAYFKHNKDNYMYRKTPSVKPWEVLETISEEIMDFALLEISREIEVNELLENIYNAEFQY